MGRGGGTEGVDTGERTQGGARGFRATSGGAQLWLRALGARVELHSGTVVSAVCGVFIHDR